MKTTVGLWIDHKKAVIVFVTGQEKEIKQIKFEKKHSQSGSSMRADDLEQRELTEHLNHYYDEVIASLGKAESILILGPGEAKGELKKRIELTKLNGRVIAVETTDKLTDPQIVAKAREHFRKHGSAVAFSPPTS